MYLLIQINEIGKNQDKSMKRKQYMMYDIIVLVFLKPGLSCLHGCGLPLANSINVHIYYLN